jgi:hypothetical protein
MGKKCIKNVRPSKRKYCVEDSHQLRADKSIEIIRYYPRNQKRKIKILRIRGKNARRKNCEEAI